MSVIVTGMEIPKCCAKCEFNRCEYNNFGMPYGYWCAAIEEDTDDAKNSCHKDCPLKSINGLKDKINFLRKKGAEDGVYVRINDVFDAIDEYCEVKR